MVKVLFFGTAEIAKQCLKALHEQFDKFSVVGVVSQVDKIQNRKREIIFSPVKQYAVENNLPLYQPTNLKEFIAEVKKLNPDIILTCAYGKIIPIDILKIPQYHAINVHGSILPKYRGASPIQSAILNQDKTTGITLMYMNEKMDEGNIIKKYEISIAKNETTSSLFKKMEDLAYEIIKNDFISCCQSNVPSIAQNHDEATYCSLIKREHEFINWNNPSKKIIGQIRCLYEQPLATSKVNGIDLKIGVVNLSEDKSIAKPGTIIKLDKTGMHVATQDQVIIIESIKIPGKKIQMIKQIINGNLPFKVGDCFSK